MGETDDDEQRKLNSVKTYLQKPESESSDPTANALPVTFFMKLVMRDLHLRLVEPGRIIFYMKIPPRLVNGDNRLHVGAITMMVDVVCVIVRTVGHRGGGVSLEINVSCFETAYLGEEIEVEAKALCIKESIAGITVELRKKNTGKIIALGRHTLIYPLNFSKL